MKKVLLAGCVLFAFASCDAPEQNTAVGNSEDSLTVKSDSLGDTRGMKGSGVDNTGGTPGPGTITDTLNGGTDTADHTSKRGADSPKK